MLEINEENLKKVVQWYNKKRENLKGEEEIVSLSISQLKFIFDISDEDTSDEYDPYMAYVYPIKEEHIQYLQPHLKHKINLNAYDYFISTYTRE